MPWNNQANRLDIACKELIPIILACAVWGREWAGHHVTCYCDNQVVVASIRSSSSKQPHLMQLLHCLAFAEASLNFNVHPVYISTKVNHLADDLSRNCSSSIISKVTQADQSPMPVSHNLTRLLLGPQADWIWEPWHYQFQAIFKMA